MFLSFFLVARTTVTLTGHTRLSTVGKEVGALCDMLSDLKCSSKTKFSRPSEALLLLKFHQSWFSAVLTVFAKCKAVSRGDGMNQLNFQTLPLIIQDGERWCIRPINAFDLSGLE